jgi:hypothetical protein
MKRALIVGGAASVWDDVERALDLSEYDGVIVVKRMLHHWKGPLTAFVTLHPELIATSLRERRHAGLPMNDFLIITTRNETRRDVKVDHVLADWGGSSGLFAVKAAQHLGFDRNVLCGIPITATPHFDRAQDWKVAYNYQKGWRNYFENIRYTTRSMSGWTRSLLGEPTEAWLRGS